MYSVYLPWFLNIDGGSYVCFSDLIVSIQVGT